MYPFFPQNIYHSSVRKALVSLLLLNQYNFANQEAEREGREGGRERGGESERGKERERERDRESEREREREREREKAVRHFTLIASFI